MSRPKQVLPISVALLCLTSALPVAAEQSSKPPSSRLAQLVVDCRAKDRAISPYIYGMVGADWELGMSSATLGRQPNVALQLAAR